MKVIFETGNVRLLEGPHDRYSLTGSPWGTNSAQITVHKSRLINWAVEFSKTYKYDVTDTKQSSLTSTHEVARFVLSHFSEEDIALSTLIEL